MGNVIKVTHDGGWSAVPNALIEARDISWRAKGVWAYMYSRPDGWEIREADMISRSTDGRHVLRSTISELEERGYLVKTASRDGGRFSHVTYSLRIPSTDSPSTGEPSTVAPSSEDRPVSKKEESNTEEKQLRAVLVRDAIAWIASYPERDAPLPKSATIKSYLYVRNSGVSKDDLDKSLHNYRSWCADNGRVGSRYVLSPISFLNAHWQDWLDRSPKPKTVKSSDGFTYIS